MRRLMFFAAMAIMVCVVCASAETITVRLPQLEQQYMTYQTQTTTFDLGTTLSFIGQARIKFKGTFYPGKAYFWYDPPALWFYYSDALKSIMDPPESDLYWQAISDYYGTQCAFVSEKQFTWYGPGVPSWVFLLDGQGQVDTRLQGIVPLSWVILEQAKAYIDEAYMIIEEEIRLASPNGNEALLSGTKYTINWTDLRPTGCSGNYQLDYSTDNGLNWIPIDSVDARCSYDWILPAIDSNSCLVKVVDAADPNILDTSDAPLAIHRLNYDLTGDLFMDFADFAVFALYWMDGTCSAPNWCGGVDFDHSGSVNSFDLATFTRYWLEDI
jgi:hypothetical protein